MGKTRPLADGIDLPRVSGPTPPAYPLAADIDEALANVRHAANWINRFTTPFFDRSGGDDDSDLAEFRGKVEVFRQHIAEVDALYPEGHSYTAEIEVYHRELERAFALVFAPDDVNVRGAGDPAGAAEIAQRAREILLNEVILPYNRQLGRR
jgi:hypothetical protein